MGCLAVLFAGWTTGVFADNRIDFDIPSQRADQALTLFAQQAGISVLFPYDRVGKYTANRLAGRYTINRGLQKLLKDTGLEVKFDNSADTLTVFILAKGEGPMENSNQKRKLGIIPAIVAGLIGGMTSGMAGAQQGSLEEIVVTAQKREQTVMDVPLAVQGFSGAELERTGFRDLTDIINLVPGASQGRSTNAGSNSYQFRGVSGYYGDSTTGYYLDEAAFAIPNRNFAPVARTFDVERVEVLRGPQGTLYGLGAMGGTVRFITAEPDLEETVIRGGAGVSDTKDGDMNYFTDLAVSVPIIKDKLAVRGVASFEEKGGWAESPSYPGEKDEDQIENYRIKVLAKPTEDWTLKGTYQRVEVKDDYGKGYAVTGPQIFNPILVQPIQFPASLDHGIPYKPTVQYEYDMYTGFVSYDAGPFVIESATGFIDLESPVGRQPLLLGPISARLDSTSERDMFTSELRFVSQHEGPWEWVLGGIYQDNESTENIYADDDTFPPPPLAMLVACPATAMGAPGTLTPPGVNCTIRDESTTYHSKSYAIFGEVSYGFLEGRLRTLVGLRYFKDDRDFMSVNRNTPTGIPFVETKGDDFDSLNPRFNVSYDLNKDMMVYVNIAKGYRSGTFNSNAVAVSSGGLLPQTVDPDDIWSYEGGAKLTLADGRLQLEAALYYWDWKDVQLNFSVAGTAIQGILNAGDVGAIGFDYGISWLTPIEGLTLQATGNINSTEYDTLRVVIPNSGVVLGNQVPGVPEHNHTFSANYTRPIAGYGVDFNMNGSYTYIGEQGDQTTIVMGDSQELLRLRAGISTDRWGAYVVGNNLLDENGPYQLSGSGAQIVYPRTIGVEINFDY